MRPGQGWRETAQICVPTGGIADVVTAPLADLGQSRYQVFDNYIDAAVMIVTIPIALIVIFAQSRIVSGLAAGALK